MTCAGIMRLPGSLGSKDRYGRAKNEVIAIVGDPLRIAAPDLMLEVITAGVAHRSGDGIARGEPFTDADGRRGEIHNGRIYDVRPLDVVRARHPRVTWIQQRLRAGDGIHTADVALFGCVDGECIAIVAACRPEGGPL